MFIKRNEINMEFSFEKTKNKKKKLKRNYNIPKEIANKKSNENKL